MFILGPTGDTSTDDDDGVPGRGIHEQNETKLRETNARYARERESSCWRERQK